MTPQPPADVVFSLSPEITPQAPAPQQIKAEQDGYEAEAGYETFPSDIAEEGGPDQSVYLMGAMWDGATQGAYQQDTGRHGYFIARQATGPWRWVLWRCSWDDNYSRWFWSDDAATDWATEDASAAGEALIRHVWANWVEQGDDDRPTQFDGGLIDDGTAFDMINEVFGEAPEPDDEEGDNDESEGASALTTRVVADLMSYGLTNDAAMIGPLRVLYREWIEEVPPGVRKSILEFCLTNIEGGRLETNVLLPFVGCETDGQVASTAALSFAMMHPTSAEEPMLGVVLLARGISGGTISNPGAVFGGLLSVGDLRVNKVLWPLREAFLGADLDEVVRVRTGRLSAPVIGFLLDWLEQMPADQREDRFNPICAALVNQRVTAMVPLVALGGRVWPVAEATPEEEDEAADFVPLASYARSIRGRLEALREIAPEPEVVDYVLTAWDVDEEDEED